MSIESHTVINVAKMTKTLSGTRFVHFFRVSIESAPQFCKAQINELVKKFPAPKYEVSVTYWDVNGRDVDMQTLRVAE